MDERRWGQDDRNEGRWWWCQCIRHTMVVVVVVSVCKIHRSVL